MPSSPGRKSLRHPVLLDAYNPGSPLARSSSRCVTRHGQKRERHPSGPPQQASALRGLRCLRCSSHVRGGLAWEKVMEIRFGGPHLLGTNGWIKAPHVLPSFFCRGSRDFFCPILFGCAWSTATFKEILGGDLKQSRWGMLLSYTLIPGWGGCVWVGVSHTTY